MKRIVCILLILSTLCGTLGLTACGDKTPNTPSSEDPSEEVPEDPTEKEAVDTSKIDASLRFSDFQNESKLQELQGKTVSVVGFTSKLSPLDGSFIYLMSLPYQACPYCKPNTQELAAGALPVYVGKGCEIRVTDDAVRVIGQLEIGDFTDTFGYQSKYRLTGSVGKKYTMEDTPMGRALSSIAADGTTDKLYLMFDYVYFLCAWPIYTAQFGGMDYREYLFPEDVFKFFLEPDKGQYHYGYAKGYFDGIRKALRAVDAETLKDVITLVDDCEALAADALAELRSIVDDVAGEGKQENYSKKYVTYEGHEMWQYSFTASDAFLARYDALYARFASCLAGGEN